MFGCTTVAALLSVVVARNLEPEAARGTEPRTRRYSVDVCMCVQLRSLWGSTLLVVFVVSVLLF